MHRRKKTHAKTFSKKKTVLARKIRRLSNELHSLSNHIRHWSY